MQIGITDPLVVGLRHVALVGAVAAVAVSARGAGPIDDAGQIGNEAAEHGFRRDAIGDTQVDELGR